MTRDGAASFRLLLLLATFGTLSSADTFLRVACRSALSSPSLSPMMDILGYIEGGSVAGWRFLLNQNELVVDSLQCSRPGYTAGQCTRGGNA